jgi:F-box interacting protein
MSKRSPSIAVSDWYINNYGFGYDMVNDKYKFLMAIRNTYMSVAKIYTFGEDSWTTIQNFPINPHERLGKFVSGTLNWLADKRSASSKQCVILSFDLEKESYREILLPQIDVGYMGPQLLYVLNNCLCVFFKTSKTHWALWSMKEYGVFESWTKLMIIPHQTITMNREFSFIHPLFFSENGIVLLVYSRTHKLGLYNFRSGGSDFDYPSVSSKLGIDRHIYHESLVSPQR